MHVFVCQECQGIQTSRNLTFFNVVKFDDQQMFWIEHNTTSSNPKYQTASHDVDKTTKPIDTVATFKKHLSWTES